MLPPPLLPLLFPVLHLAPDGRSFWSLSMVFQCLVSYSGHPVDPCTIHRLLTGQVVPDHLELRNGMHNES